MAEYIEKQAVIDILHNLSYDDWNQGVSTTWANAFSECAEMVRNIHPADVRPVVRGRWVDEHFYKQTMSGKTYDGFTYCSNCKQDFSFGYRSKFCPNCGADTRNGDADG